MRLKHLKTLGHPPKISLSPLWGQRPHKGVQDSHEDSIAFVNYAIRRETWP